MPFQRSLRFSVALAAVCALDSTFALSARAAWPNDPKVNVPICQALNGQHFVRVVPDGSGGAIMAWHDERVGADADIYAQRVDSAGTPLWAPGGVAVATGATAQFLTDLLGDGNGGAFVAWNTDQTGATSSDVYVQRLDNQGALGWGPNGILVCGATGVQGLPHLASDQLDGAIVTWEDYRGGTSDIYAQRLDRYGALLWTANGVVVCSASGFQYAPVVVGYPRGESMIAWIDYRTGGADVYANWVRPNGTLVGTPAGAAVCTAPGDQGRVRIVASLSRTAVIAWQDRHNGSWDMYAQRMQSAGTPMWTINGVALCTASKDQTEPVCVTDGSGGAIMAWQDFRNNLDWNVYAQRVTSAGTVLWGANGLATCVQRGDQTDVDMTADGTGGALLAWTDARSGSNTHIYAQRIKYGGSLPWGPLGLAVGTADILQYDAALTSDGQGGAIAAWSDLRSGTTLYDIYAQRFSGTGTLGPFPAAPPPPSDRQFTEASQGAGAIPDALPNPGPQTRVGGAGLLLEGVAPNPVHGDATVRLALGRAAHVQLSLFDARGRRVRAMRPALLASGTHTLTLPSSDAAGRPLPAGVYYVRVESQGEVASRSVAVIR